MEILLGDLKNALCNIDADVILVFGFDNPHSYRGMYDCVSFEPTSGKRVADIIGSVFNALDNQFTGWKGGEFWYEEDTPVFFAHEGCTESGVGCHEYRYESSDLRKYFFNLVKEYKEKINDNN